MSVAGTLQRQPLSVVAEVRLGILATEGHLTNGSEMILARGCLHHTAEAEYLAESSIRRCLTKPDEN